MVAGLVKPKALRPGATIGVAAISGPVDEGKIEAGIARLRAMGYRVVEASNLRRRCGLFAGTDEERAAGYLELVRNPNVDAIFFARGGYGAARVLPHLSAREIRASPKIHLGGSDLTALFAWLHREAGLVAFYGPMVAVEMPSEDGLDWEAVLAGALPPAHRFAPEDVLSPGRAQGLIVGGCLSLLASLAGTPQALSAEGSVLFWEDVGEPAYRLDRMITQLEQAGTFDRLRGMVIGSLVPTAGEAPDSLREWLVERFRGASFPVAMNLPGGHLSRPRTLPLGVRVLLTPGSEDGLAYLEPGVERL
jgi:muramoyltetrapeptide carboxypeptidase